MTPQALHRHRPRRSSRLLRVSLAAVLVVVGLVGYAPAASAAATYTEYTGVQTHTWSNFTNAGGTAGPVYPASAPVSVDCVEPNGFQVQDGNRNWYHIAGTSFYASADAFYNNGQTSGSLRGTPWVDPRVPTCASLPRGNNETAGMVANTWTNPANAGGTAGPRIAAGQTVQIACKLAGFKVANGNTWWYRIASSPWNSAYYVSADAFYNNGQTSGALKGTPWVDAAVPTCAGSSGGSGGSTGSKTTATVTLAKGPAVSGGYRYLITLGGFAPNTVVPVQCYDSVSPNGFYPFSLKTNAAGAASTSAYCYSGDGPDHWVVAGGIASNHVSWEANASADGSNPRTTPPQSPPSGSSASNRPVSPVNATFFSPNNDARVLPGLTVSQNDLKLKDWSAGSCEPRAAWPNVPMDTNTLAGWSLGRLGPVYFLNSAPKWFVSNIRTIVLFDPGSTSNFAEPSWIKQLAGRSTCDWKFKINELLANWLSSNSANHLIIITGKDSEEKASGRSTYAGLWKFYLAGIWKQQASVRSRAQVCDYDNMGHEDTLRKFASIVKNPVTGCPVGPKLTAWHP